MSTHDNYIPSNRTIFYLVLGIGAVTFTAGILDSQNWGADARTAGAVILVGGLVRWAVPPAFAAQLDIYRSPHQQGHDQGWHEGRRSARPVVIRMEDRW